MIEALTGAPLRNDLESPSAVEECEVLVNDGPRADDESGLIASMALERFEAWASPNHRPTAVLDAMDRLATSATVDECVRRFAAAEADVADPTLAGLGRVSGARVARLGGLLHGRVACGTAEAIVRTAVERTIRTGYLAAVLTHQVVDRADPRHHGG